MYIDKVDKKIRDYFKIIEEDFPLWLNDYIETKELLGQQYISMTCGTIYSKLFDYDNIFYSSLDHSIGVALIVWHFTHDKVQTLSGLFHDIATPCFKHCVDFMNGDHMTQESTEDLTTNIISNSKEIMKLLKRDNIKVSEVDNYHLYPIADNDTPMLSADRLEYSMSNALLTYKVSDYNTIKDMFNDIYIINNNGVDELGFKHSKYALELVKITSKLSIIYREYRTNYSMQLIADILKRLNEERLIKREDLYRLKESEVIDIIEKSKYSNAFNIWKNAKKVKLSDKKLDGVYSIKLSSKIRYINPLVNNERIYDINKTAKKLIDNNLAYNTDDKYVYLDNLDIESNELKIGRVYKHFKGDYYLVEGVCKYSETKEDMVIYRRLYGDGDLWVRPKDMFLSEVDHKKYPGVKQKYRFQLQDIDSVAGNFKK